jgi:predicted GTPase
VLVVDDGPTITHGGMPFGAAAVAARAARVAEMVDPRPWAVGSLRQVYETYPHIGAVLPAMGYGDEQLADLAATIAATPCDAVLSGTPIDLASCLATTGIATPPIRRVTYDLDEVSTARLAELLAPYVDTWLSRRTVT